MSDAIKLSQRNCFISVLKKKKTSQVGKVIIFKNIHICNFMSLCNIFRRENAVWFYFTFSLKNMNMLSWVNAYNHWKKKKAFALVLVCFTSFENTFLTRWRLQPELFELLTQFYKYWLILLSRVLLSWLTVVFA